MTVVCVDLDRTVIYSPAALDLHSAGPGGTAALCVEFYRRLPSRS